MDSYELREEYATRNENVTTIKQVSLLEIPVECLGKIMMANEKGEFDGKRKVNGFNQVVIRMNGRDKQGFTGAYSTILPDTYEGMSYSVFVRSGNVPTERKDDWEAKIALVTFRPVSEEGDFESAVARAVEMVEEYKTKDVDVVIRLPYLNKETMELEAAEKAYLEAKSKAEAKIAQLENKLRELRDKSA